MDKPQQSENCVTCGHPDLPGHRQVNWVACDKCNDWHHQACVKVIGVIDEDTPWMCEKCKNVGLVNNDRAENEQASGSADALNATGGNQVLRGSGPTDQQVPARLHMSGNLNYVFPKPVNDADDDQRPVTRQEMKELLSIVKQLAIVASNPVSPEVVRDPVRTGAIPKVRHCEMNRNAFSSRDQFEDDCLSRSSSRHSLQSDIESDAIENIGRRVAQQSHDEVSTRSATVNNGNDISSSIATLVQMMQRQQLDELPKFSGHEDSWPLFFAAYNDTEAFFKPHDNLRRLRHSLKGDALRLVQNDLWLPESLQRVLNKLKLEYGQTHVSARRLVARIQSQAAPEFNNAEAVKRYRDELSNCVSTLKSLKAIKYLDTPVIPEQLVQRFPLNVRIKWRQYVEEALKKNAADVGLEDFEEWFYKTTKWCLMEAKTSAKSRVRLNVHEESDVENGDSTQQAAAKNENDKKKSCVCCKDSSHLVVTKCPKFLKSSVGARWSVAKQKKLCFICLEKFHKKECPNKKECGKDGCPKFHHQLLHRESIPTPDTGGIKDKAVSSGAKDKVVESKLNVNIEDGCEANSYSRIIPVKLSMNGNSVTTNAFFDEGSDSTIITQELATQLGLSGPNEPLCLVWSNGDMNYVDNSERVCVEISGMERNSSKFVLKNVRTAPHSALDLSKPIINVEEVKQKYKYMRGLNIPQPFTDKQPQILLGSAHPKLGIARDFREGSWEEPVVTRTLLGWVVHGTHRSTRSKSQLDRCLVICECSNQTVDLHKMIENYFSTENFGVRVVDQPVEAVELARANKLLESTTKLCDGRVETGLLWKHDDVTLPNSRPMAVRRMLCLEKQMQRDPALGVAIKERIEENRKCGYVSKLTNSEVNNVTKRTWYLPIFAVKNPHKPTKTRVVYDAAVAVDGVSLNDNLLVGPDLLKPLVGVLMRAREGAVAVAGDIKDMYHRILIRSEDRNSQRFLWRDNPNEEPDTYVLNVMSFGAKCSPSSAQYAKNYNASRFKDNYPEAVDAIIENTYVDDLLVSFVDDDAALKTCQDITMIHSAGGFEIRNWMSNSKRVMQTLNGHELGPTAEISWNLDDDSVDKILGLFWNMKQDTLAFKLRFVRVDVEIVAMKRVPTKREFLKVLMAVFDPIGFATPILVHGKILLQEIWRRRISWDDKVPDDLFKNWCKWLIELRQVESISLQRCYKIPLHSSVRIQLHVFADASEEAFCAVAYFRISDGSNVNVRFVTSKNKVAPIKHLSIPRLELQAAVLAARMAQLVLSEHSLKVSKVVYWSDSRTVLGWIASDHRRYKSFVANRISELLDTTRIEEWLWVPSEHNPADIGTKKQAELDLTETGMWFSGPLFLKNPDEETWPSVPTTDKEVTEELRPSQLLVSRNIVPMFSCIDPLRFSNWFRLIRTVGWILRWRNIIKKKRKRNSGQHELEANEVKEAEYLVLRKIQWELFPNDILKLQKNEVVDKDSQLYKLSPYIDEQNLVRMKGRIDATPYIAEEFKRPIILLRNHPIVKLLLMAYHHRYHHQHQETAINELRQRFWIPQARVAMKEVVSRCQRCKNQRAGPQVPEMAPLPAERLAIREEPFTYSGMDYFGPLMVTVGRSQVKRYGVLFTCLTVRAVHVELADTLNTDSCVLAIRNFMCRRGSPKIMFSDNGTNMHGAESELRREIVKINKDRLKAEGQSVVPGDQITEWRFITPRAPHMGGPWERLVRSVKQVIYSCLKERAPREELLRNFLIEAENVVNSRPLTYQPLDPGLKEAITPNHLLRMAGKIVSSPIASTETIEAGRKTWKYSQQLADEFWKRFVLEYLPEATRRTKWYADMRPLKEGDHVLIIDECAPRNVWERATIKTLHVGPDGKTRSATVQTAHTTRKRPVAKLALLDI